MKKEGECEMCKSKKQEAARRSQQVKAEAE